MRVLGIGIVGRALEMAVRRNCFSYDGVACIARALAEDPQHPAPLSPEGHPNLPQVPPTTVDLRSYDALLAGGAHHGS